MFLYDGIRTTPLVKAPRQLGTGGGQSFSMGCFQWSCQGNHASRGAGCVIYFSDLAGHDSKLVINGLLACTIWFLDHALSRLNFWLAVSLSALLLTSIGS